MEAISKLAVLPPRPPTPPKETSTSICRNGGGQIDLPKLSRKQSRSGPGTPEVSPNHSQQADQKSSDKPSKRVGFLIGPGGVTPVTTSSPEALGSSQANASSSKPRLPKSILKQPTNPPQTLASLKPTAKNPADFPRMLDDITVELTNPDLGCRLDAYVSLNGCLKTYKTQSTLEALIEKSPLICDFVQRDLTCTKEDGVRNTQLTLEVLRLVTTLVWSPTTDDLFPTSTQAFIVDQAISTIASENASKQLVNQYLHLLSVQNFRRTVMTNDRVTRLLTHLKTLTDRVTGKQVVSHRLTVYRRLISQVRAIMLPRLEDWVENIFHGMMADTREIRVRAIQLGLDTQDTFGNEASLARAVKECFKTQSHIEETELRYGDMFINRLLAWLDSKEDARLVPQIWSTIVLLLRQSPRNLERWSFIVAWLKIIQKCINSSDGELKIQANRAWTRFIYAISPGNKTGSSMLSLLRDPITGQLNRTKDRESKKIRSSTYSVYYTLLYYAFRPGLEPVTITRHWESYVEQFASSSSGVPSLDVGIFCGVLVSLFGANGQQPWVPGRVLTSDQIRSDEIPRLDSKWVRSNVAMVFRLINQLMLSESWWNQDDGQTPILKVWVSLLKTVNEAGAKEIKVSMEAMRVMAEVLGSIHRYLIHANKAAAPSEGISSTALERISALVQTAAECLGPLLFIEKRLVKSSSDCYLPTETPSSRSTNVSGELLSSAGHLLRLLTSMSAGGYVSDYENLFSVIIDITLQTASSRKSKLKVLREATQHIGDAHNQNAPAKIALWKIVAWRVQPTIEMEPPQDSNSDTSYQLGHDFRDSAKILETGLHINTAEIEGPWLRTCDVIERQAQKEAGIGAPALVVIEPLAKCLLEVLSTGWHESMMIILDALLSSVRWPTDNELERSYRSLWGASMIRPLRVFAVGPFDHLFKLLGSVLETLFDDHTDLSQTRVRGLFMCLPSFVKSIPASSLNSFLNTTQNGIASVLRDSNGLLQNKSTDSRAILKDAANLWCNVLEKMEASISLDETSLTNFQRLLHAGLASKHRIFANTTIEVWNRTVGRVEGISYPKDLTDILYRLSYSTEILLGGIPIYKSSLQSPPIEYYDTPASFEDFDQELPLGKPNRDTSKNQRQTSRGYEKASLRSDTPSQQTPERQKRNLSTTPKLRHDDSQIQFAVVDSSPSRIESQLLTEHQREVRERQEEEANAMFADLRSSPKVKDQGKDRSQPRLCLQADHIVEHSDNEDMNSPILPTEDDTGFLGSSPTPSQRRSSSRENIDCRQPPSPRNGLLENDDLLMDLPSSPPTVSTRTQAKYPTNEPTILERAGEDSTTAENGHQIAREERVRDVTPGPEVVVNATEKSTVKTKSSPLDSNTGLIRNMVESQDKDLFMNGPREEVAASKHSTPQSIGSSASKVFPYAPNSVEAQIFIDMERAASQSRSQESKFQDEICEMSKPEPLRQNKRSRSSSLSENPKRKKGRGRPKKNKPDEAPPIVVAEEEEVLDSIVLAESKVNESKPKSQKRSRRIMERDEGLHENHESPVQKKQKVLSDGDSGVGVKQNTHGEAEPMELEGNETEEENFHSSLELPEEAVEDGTLVADVDQISSSQPSSSVSLDAAPGAEVRVPEVTTEHDGEEINKDDGPEVLAQVRALLDQVKAARIESSGDEIIATLMEVGREVMEAKRKVM